MISVPWRLGALLALTMALAAPGLASAAGLAATIDGAIVDKTPAATLQPGSQAYLYRLPATGDPSQVAQTNVDAAGHFRFDVVQTDPSDNFEVGVQYGGAPYFSDKLSFAPGQTSKQVELDVYEPASDDSVLSISSTSLLIEPDPKTHDLAVLELNNFVNSSDRMFVPNTTPRNGGPPPLLRFSLPADATDLTAGEGVDQQDIIQINNGFGALAPVTPGNNNSIGFSFRSAYQTSSATIAMNVEYPTKAFRVLMPVDQGHVSSPQLQHQTDQTIGGKQYQLLLATDLKPGANIRLSFSGLPGISPLAVLAQPRALPWLAALLAAIVLGLMGWYVRDRRRQARGPEAPVAAEDLQELRTKRRELLVSLARLDDRHDAGLIAEEDYQAQRDAQKTELRDLMLRLES